MMKCHRVLNPNSMRDPNSMLHSNKMLHELSEERNKRALKFKAQENSKIVI